MVDMRCSLQHAKTLLFPEPDLLKYLSRKAWKFQIVLVIFQLLYLVFALIESNSISWFYMSIALTFRILMLLCGRISNKVFIYGNMACFVVDSFCNIMSHTEMQNTVWLSMYSQLPGNDGHPPCPECFPDIEGSMLIALWISYMLMFVLPFRCAACTVPFGVAAYVIMLVNARWNNYEQFGEKFANDVKIMTIDEVILFSAILIFSIAAKIIMEISEAELYYALKESQGTVLHEKILRCKAEYASECMKTVATECEKEDMLSSFCTTSAGGHYQSAKSATSAPAILEPQRFQMCDVNEESLPLQGASPCRGDCIQEDDVVWTNEFPHPIPAKQVVQGHHVLCYDHLSKSLKHAEVLKVARQADPVQWATIALTDGSTVRVTADHPFLTEEQGTPSPVLGPAQVPVRASELKPHIDKVLVMKVVPIDVQSVELDPLDKLKEQARVAIDIQQPRRHSVFVSRRDHPTPEIAAAVGASNLDFVPETYDVRARATFVDIFDAQPVLRRTNSSPACLESTVMESTAMESVMKAPITQNASVCVKSTSSPSTLSSEVTSVSADDCADDCNIRIGSKLRPIRDASGTGRAIAACEAPDGESYVGLQDILHLRRSGVPSIGSFQHCKSGCTAACWFENQRQHGRLKQCSVGILCERCHFDHAFLKRGRRAALNH